MGQSRETVRIIELTASGGANDIVRVWNEPISEPTKALNIFLSTAGEISTSGNVSWDVIYGGRFKDGAPYEEGSTHIGGISQSSGTLAAVTELAHRIYTDDNCFPTNRRTIIPNNSTPLTKGLNGFPTVVKITNVKTVPIKIIVTFVDQVISDKQ